MQIPASSTAALAAGIAAQASSKDALAQANPAASQTQAINGDAVEKSNEASPDRDAQGQGDGLPGNAHKHAVDELEISDEQAPAYRALPQLPGEPPSQLDIIG